MFPSNFFVSKVNKITDNKMIFAINGEFQEIDIKNNEVRKKDYIIVRKEDDGYKLVKVIGKVQELDSVDDLERIYNLFNPYSVSYTFKELLKITKADEKELHSALEELENEGIAYYDPKNNVYKTMPSNYFVTTAEVTRKNFYIVNFNGITYTLPYENTTGILPYDKVLLKKQKKIFIL